VSFCFLVTFDFKIHYRHFVFFVVFHFQLNFSFIFFVGRLWLVGLEFSIRVIVSVLQFRVVFIHWIYKLHLAKNSRTA